MYPNKTRAGQRGTLAVLATLILLPLWAFPAHAADAYRYWSYWWGEDGSWAFAQTGPADRVVSDGAVEGWLFLVSTDAVPTEQPRTVPDFAAICADVPAAPGAVRVGVVIDYGSADITPDGSTLPDTDNPSVSCVTVPEGATAAQALAEAAEVRTEQGAVCGLDGYPATGCFELVPSTSSMPAAGDGAADSSSPAPGIWLAAGAIAMITALVVILVVRSRRTPSA